MLSITSPGKEENFQHGNSVAILEKTLPLNRGSQKAENTPSKGEFLGNQRDQHAKIAERGIRDELAYLGRQKEPIGCPLEEISEEADTEGDIQFNEKSRA